MMYYQARRDAYDYFNAHGVVADELLTPRERAARVPHLSDGVFAVVNVSRQKTYTSFGCRFKCDHARRVHVAYIVDGKGYAFETVGEHLDRAERDALNDIFRRHGRRPDAYICQWKDPAVDDQALILRVFDNMNDQAGRA